MKIGIFISDKPQTNLHGLFSAQRKWGTPSEIETRRRIRIALYAYAYEVKEVNLIEDHVYDKECIKVFNYLHINTKRPDLDNWFRENFDPSTGMWVWNHPEFDKLAKLYHELHGANHAFD